MHEFARRGATDERTRRNAARRISIVIIAAPAMLDMMGHVSLVMLRRYSHIRAQARREANDALGSRHNRNVAAKGSAKASESEGHPSP